MTMQQIALLCEHPILIAAGWCVQWRHFRGTWLIAVVLLILTWTICLWTLPRRCRASICTRAAWLCEQYWGIIAAMVAQTSNAGRAPQNSGDAPYISEHYTISEQEAWHRLLRVCFSEYSKSLRSSAAFIGLSDEHAAGTWRWTNGRAATWVRWVGSATHSQKQAP